MLNRKLKFILCVLFIGISLLYCINSLNNQKNVTYVCKNEVMKIFKENCDYFEVVANFYEKTEHRYVLYDSSAGSFVPDIDIGVAEQDIIIDLFKKYSFNQIERDGSYLCITYLRPFDHSVIIGLIYDYDLKKWEYTYHHNYTRCSQGHLNGYRIFDILCN